jgi:hypothetical protein
MLPSISGLSRLPFKQIIAGSNPAGSALTSAVSTALFSEASYPSHGPLVHSAEHWTLNPEVASSILARVASAVEK